MPIIKIYGGRFDHLSLLREEITQLFLDASQLKLTDKESVWIYFPVEHDPLTDKVYIRVSWLFDRPDEVEVTARLRVDLAKALTTLLASHSIVEGTQVRCRIETHPEGTTFWKK